MDQEERPDTITSISVKGFKSLAEEQRVEIRPLTLLAGANSSGKSSLLQPLLLLKQTLEAAYDPGPLLLAGPNVKFTSARQMLSSLGGKHTSEEFEIGLSVDSNHEVRSIFRRNAAESFDLVREVHHGAEGSYHLAPKMTEGQVKETLPFLKGFRGSGGSNWRIVRFRSFLGILSERAGIPALLKPYSPNRPILTTIHVPGLRGNPEREYPTSAVGEFFEGTFENYVASIILSWQKDEDEKLSDLSDALLQLGLASKVEASPLDATRVELLVTRLAKRTKASDKDLVNIADVGFGVSQVLPVIVALLQAKPGQLVYIEQPELHLHPRAQQALASILADAAKRGVRIVAETHSSILLLAVQTLVAEDKLNPADVILHWFQRDKRGATKITSAELDERGAYGEWPVDFGDVEAAVENRYLNAVEEKMFARTDNGQK